MPKATWPAPAFPAISPSTQPCPPSIPAEAAATLPTVPIYLRRNIQVLFPPPSPCARLQTARVQNAPRLSLSSPNLLEAQTAAHHGTRRGYAYAGDLRHSASALSPPVPPLIPGPSIQQDLHMQLKPDIEHLTPLVKEELTQMWQPIGKGKFERRVLQKTIEASSRSGATQYLAFESPSWCVEREQALLFLQQPPVHPGLPLTNPFPTNSTKQVFVDCTGSGTKAAPCKSHIFCRVSEVSLILGRMEPATPAQRRQPAETRSAPVLETQSLTCSASSSQPEPQLAFPVAQVKEIDCSTASQDPEPLGALPHLVIRINQVVQAAVQPRGPTIHFNPEAPRIGRIDINPAGKTLEATQRQARLPRKVMLARCLPALPENEAGRYMLPEIGVLTDVAQQLLNHGNAQTPGCAPEIPRLIIRITAKAEHVRPTGPTFDFNPFMPRIGRIRVEPESLALGTFYRRMEQASCLLQPVRPAETGLVPALKTPSLACSANLTCSGYQQGLPLIQAIQAKIVRSNGSCNPEQPVEVPHLVIRICRQDVEPLSLPQVGLAIRFNPEAPRIGRKEVEPAGSESLAEVCSASSQSQPQPAETRSAPVLETQSLTCRASSWQPEPQPACPVAQVKEIDCSTASQDPEPLGALPHLVIRINQVVQAAAQPRGPTIHFNPEAPRIGRIDVKVAGKTLEATQRQAPIPRQVMLARCLPALPENEAGRYMLPEIGNLITPEGERCRPQPCDGSQDLGGLVQLKHTLGMLAERDSWTMRIGPIFCRVHEKPPLILPAPKGGPGIWHSGPCMKPHQPPKAEVAEFLPSGNSSNSAAGRPFVVPLSGLQPEDSDPKEQGMFNHQGSEEPLLSLEIPKIPRPKMQVSVRVPMAAVHHPIINACQTCNPHTSCISRVLRMPSRYILPDELALTCAYRTPRNTQKAPVLPNPPPNPVQVHFFKTAPPPVLQAPTPVTIALTPSNTLSPQPPHEQTDPHTQPTISLETPQPPKRREKLDGQLTSTLGGPKGQFGKPTRSPNQKSSPGPGDYSPEHPKVFGRIPGRVPGFPQQRRDPDIRL